MTRAGDQSSDRDTAGRRHELRRWARDHHPDVGGDLDAYVAGVQRIERRWAASTGSTGSPAVTAPLRISLAPWPIRVSRRLRRRLLARRRSRRSAVL